MSLRLAPRNIQGITVIDCSGRIVFGEEASELRELVKKLLAENSRVVLNLGEVSYIDSGGIGTLVSLFTTARNAGGDIKLLHLTKRVGDLLQITKLITVFETYDDQQAALTAFNTPARNVSPGLPSARRESA
jgi:anti-sigma B factor antagonist